MPSNGKLVSILNMTSFTGGFKNELQTKEEPYAWRMIFENDFSKNRKEAFEERLRMYSYVLLAQIGNLDEVIYEYSMDGEKTELSVTSEDATAFAGVDIKTVGEDINRLEMLVRKTGLSNIILGGDLVESNGQVDFSYSDDVDRVLQFTVVNYAEDDIYGMQLKVLCDGQEANQSMTEASHTALQKGINVDFQLIPEDFEKEIENGSLGTIRLVVFNKDGKAIEVQGECYTDLVWGSKGRLNLSGNAKTGYFIGK